MTIGLMIISAALTTAVIMGSMLQINQPALAAGVLSSVFSQPTNNIVSTMTTYQITFTTATTGTLKTITISFPPGYDFSSFRLTEVNGIGPGATTLSGTTLVYTISTPISIPAGKPIRFEFSNIRNPIAPALNVAISVATRDLVGNYIDGPTPSSRFNIKQIVASDIAPKAVTNTHIADNSVQTNHIANSAIDTTKLKIGAVKAGNIADSAIGTNHISPGAVVANDISQSFMKLKILKNDAAGNAHGWNPNGLVGTKSFFIKDSDIIDPSGEFPDNTFIFIMGRGTENGACWVDELFTNGEFVVNCSEAPYTSAELHYVIMKLPPNIVTSLIDTPHIPPIR
jgi:hypothetical protein